MLARHADSTCCLFIINNHGRTSSNIGVYVSSTSPTLAILTTTLVTLDVHTLDIDLISPRYITDARSHSDPSSPITMSHEEHPSAEHSANSGADHHAAVASFTPTIAAISIKLPPFWPADPVVWFAQVEAQFATRRVTSQKTQFDYVVSSLGPEFATEVRDLLLRPPEDTPYDILKAELIKRTAASEQRKLQQLISGEELGDRKPTQLLRRMQQLLGDHLDVALDEHAFIKELFLQRLPANVRMVLATADATTDLQKLADMADKIMEVSTPSSVSAVSAPINDDVQRLREEVERLATLIASLTQHPSQPHLRNCNYNGRYSRSPSPHPLQQPIQHSLCWYHKRFDNKARKCQAPCAMGHC